MATKETALTTSTVQKPLAISMRPAPPSASWLVKSLTALATARQASVSRDTLLLYASELADFREDDVSQAVRKIAFRPREEGETAFPDLGTIVASVKAVASVRRAEEERQKLSAERRALEEDRRLHPEKYFSFDDVLKDYAERRRAKETA